MSEKDTLRADEKEKFFGGNDNTRAISDWITTNTAEPRGQLTPYDIYRTANQRDPRYAHLPEATIVREQRERFAEAMVTALFGEVNA